MACRTHGRSRTRGRRPSWLLPLRVVCVSATLCSLTGFQLTAQWSSSNNPHRRASTCLGTHRLDNGRYLSAKEWCTVVGLGGRAWARCRLDPSGAGVPKTGSPALLLRSTSEDREVLEQEEGGRTGSGRSSMPADSVPEENEKEALLSPVRIKVVGVGGGGGNAVDGMITMATRRLVGVQFMAMNTDTQALAKSHAEVKVALGSTVTRGLGAGGKPEVGQAAAAESLPEIKKALAGADMVFITAGLGGGTGTGAAPIIAAAARSMGCVTVAVVTEPFAFEGRQRSRQATSGLAELRKAADTVLVVANDNLLEIVPEKMTMRNAFLVADDILRQGVIGTSELIVRPGLINVDFADVREIIRNSGTALIGIGTGTGKTRAEDAAIGAMVSPLMEFPIEQAAGMIFNIVGGLDMSLTEVNAAATIIQRHVHPDANIIIGALVDERYGKKVSVTVLATGFGPSVENLDVDGGEAAATAMNVGSASARDEPGHREGEEGGDEREHAHSCNGEGPEIALPLPMADASLPRPSFDGGASTGEAPSKMRISNLRRLLNRWRG